MKIRIMVVVMIAACFISGCSLVDQFQQAKTDYVETKVVELLDEIPTEEAVVVEPVVVEPVVDATEEAVAEETTDAEDKSADVEVTEEPEATEEPTEESTDADLAPEATEETDADATPESSDPGVYLGDADWTDKMDVAEFWVLGDDDYTSASLENGKYKIVALSEVDGWRIAQQPVLKNAYIETNFTWQNCSGKDEFGFYFRLPENVNFNLGYKFGITCDGLYSIRIWDGLTKKTSWLQYYKASELINKGMNQTNRIGVMMVEDSLQFFVNGEKVDELIDDTFTEGFFGLFINRDKTANFTVNVDSVSYWTDPME